MRLHKLLLITLLVFGFASAAIAQERPTANQALLEFTKQHIDEISKNSGIFEIKDPNTGSKRWFELYGIFDGILGNPNGYTVTLDATEFTSDGQPYLIFIDIAETNGTWNVSKLRIGPRNLRRNAQE